MKKLLIVFLFPFFIQGYSQNLVQNGDFENYYMHYYILCSDSSPVALDWYIPNNSNPEYMHSLSCAPTQGVPQNNHGYQYAYSGNAYYMIGVYAKDCGPPYREYIQVALQDTLKSGKKYHVSFYVSLCDSTQYAIDDIGALFTTTPMHDTNTVPAPLIIANPQIINQPGNYLTSRTEWMLISDTLIAAGGEKYITIGNFKNDANIDTLFVPGGSENTSYCFWSGYYVDDVSVELDTTNGINETVLKPDEILVYPNPAKESLTVVCYEKATIEIINIQGQVIKSITSNGKTNVDVSAFAKGMYFVKAKTENGIAVKKFVKE